MTGVIIGAVLATFSACFGIAGGVAFLFARSSRTQTAPTEPVSDPRTALLEAFGVRLGALESVVKGLPSLWEEERDRAKKHADRASAAYRGAEQILAGIENPEDDEGEDPGLFDDDEEGGGVRRLHELQERMGLPPTDDEAELRNRAQAAIAELQGMGR